MKRFFALLMTLLLLVHLGHGIGPLCGEKASCGVATASACCDQSDPCSCEAAKPEEPASAAAVVPGTSVRGMDAAWIARTIVAIQEMPAQDRDPARAVQAAMPPHAAVLRLTVLHCAFLI